TDGCRPRRRRPSPSRTREGAVSDRVACREGARGRREDCEEDARMNGITGEEIDALRSHVRPLLEWACAGGARDERHPHYTAVTEGRDPADPRYSSCG